MSSRMNIVMAGRDSDAVIQYRASPEDYTYIGA